MEDIGILLNRFFTLCRKANPTGDELDELKETRNEIVYRCTKAEAKVERYEMLFRELKDITQGL